MKGVPNLSPLGGRHMIRIALGLTLALGLPATAAAQFHAHGRPGMGPGLGPVGRPAVSPGLSRPGYYSTYDPLGYNLYLNRPGIYGGYDPFGYGSLTRYPVRYPYNNVGRIGGGIYYGYNNYGYGSAYVPVYYGSTSPVDGYSYLRSYPPLDVMPEPAPNIEAAPRPRSLVASVEVYLPNANAELWFNGVKTQQGGEKRNFVTPELTPGKVFSYEVRARWTENGQQFDQTRTIQVQAGAQVVYAFFADEKEKLPTPAEK